MTDDKASPRFCETSDGRYGAFLSIFSVLSSLKILDFPHRDVD